MHAPNRLLPANTLICVVALQHCYITGGSAGLGLGAALALVKRGAHVSIVARDQDRLDLAIKELEVSAPLLLTSESGSRRWPH